MRYLEIPEFPVLRGEKAVKALYDFIGELEGQRSEKLTERQTDALIKFAKGLISSIEEEKQATTPIKNVKEKHFVTFTHPLFQSYVTAFPLPRCVQKPI